ncbi:SDR family oxidoreductase [Streptomyces sp. NPDC090032]|uniref:SDR family oxidoreductase n=1 Tax=Streptomyces sp. NPDC090032 TaxID=3365925 RepID=UPI0037F5F6F6
MPDGGRIISIGTITGRRAFAAGFADCRATKADLSMYGRSWAHELAPRNITVNTVVSAFAATDMGIPQDSDLGRTLLSLAPMHRYAEPGKWPRPWPSWPGPRRRTSRAATSMWTGWNA